MVRASDWAGRFGATGTRDTYAVLGQNSKARENILSPFDAMERSGNAEVRAAYRRAMLARVPKSMLKEEALAYFVEAHPDLPFARRVLAWFRMLLRKIGEAFHGLNR